jgi:multiple sugar transport system permease protein
MNKTIFRISKNRMEEYMTAYLFLLMFFITWVLWFFIPLIQSVSMSFYNFSFINPKENAFIGMNNYIQLFSDEYFWIAVKNTMIFVLVTVPAVTIVSLPIAVLLNMKIKARGLFRTIYYVPNVISAIAVTTIFMYLFVKGSILSKLFELFGLPNTTWFADVKLALPFVMLIYVWQYVGFYIIIYLSGLQNISEQIYEAAKIDGANGRQTFFKITIPLIRPTLIFTMTYSVISSFQVFDQIAAISQNSALGTPAGATSTMVTFFYSNSFQYYKMGYGSAGAVVLFLLILIVSIIQKKIIGSDEI